MTLVGTFITLTLHRLGIVCSCGTRVEMPSASYSGGIIATLLHPKIPG